MTLQWGFLGLLVRYSVLKMSEKFYSEHVRIGLDDTDHPEVGCTTERLDDLLRTISEQLETVAVERKLVRLWPFAERRTRGNGALGATIAIREGKLGSLVKICKKWFSQLESRIAEYPKSTIDPSPCMVISSTNAPKEWYWEAVRNHVDADQRFEEVIGFGCEVLYSKSKWGVVGASAAVSWFPETPASWELIAWRVPKLIGTPRDVSDLAVAELETHHPQTFVNRDPTKDRGLIAPRTPCPVLYGIRGSQEDVVLLAHEWLQSRDDVERCCNFATHQTNQLSDDHIVEPLSGTLVVDPVETRGGHSHATVFSGNRHFKLVAFSEGGPVNRLLREFQSGDAISWTGLESPDGSIHLEKLRLDRPTPRLISRPVCCARTMRSAGRGQGLRCIDCGKTEPKYWMSRSQVESGALVSCTWVEPTPSNRRHLARPISHLAAGELT